MNDKNSKTIVPSYSKLLVFIGTVTLVHWLVLIFQIPIFSRLPYLDYKLHIKSLELLWIFIAFVSFGIALILSISKLNYTLKLIGIILLGTLMQYSFAFSKGAGIEALSIRITGQNHAEFAKVAIRSISIRAVVMEYETLLAEKYYAFLPSKPPGTLLFYVLTNKAAEVFLPSESKKEGLENLAIFAVLTWPLISCLAILPLFFLGRYLFDDPQLGIVASVLYVSTPSLNLITIITDQTIYPLLALFSVLLIVLACRKNNLLLAFISGAVFYGILYFSFGLAVVGFIFLLPIVVTIPLNQFRNYFMWIRYITAVILGIVTANFFAYFFLNYNIFVRYTGAITHHIQWKKWENNLETYVTAGFTNVTEFSIWIGLPIAILFLLSLYSAAKQLILRKPDLASLYNITLAGTFIFLLAFGKTKSEVARLWLFLMPFVCISIGNYINSQNWLNRNKTVFTIAILLLEIGTTFFTNKYQGH